MNSRTTIKSTAIIVVLVSILLSLTVGCERTFFEAEPGDSPEANFLFLWNTFNERYAPFEQRNVDWNQLLDKYLPAIEFIESLDDNRLAADSLFSTCAEMLGELDDTHVTLTAPGREVWNANRIIRLGIDDNKFDRDIVHKRIAPSATSGTITFSVLTELVRFDTSTSPFTRITADVGYIRVAHFLGSKPQVIDEALERMTDVVGIVIDLRHNSGGDFRNGLFFASRFADQERLAFSTETRTGSKPSDFSPRTDWYLRPDGPLQYTGPVMVITDRYTVSAAERTLLALKTLPHVQVLGDTTSGALGEKVAKELPNGWSFSLTSQIVYGADGITNEGLGIPPDHIARNDIFDIRDGRDRVLDEAFSRLTPDDLAKKTLSDL